MDSPYSYVIWCANLTSVSLHRLGIFYKQEMHSLHVKEKGSWLLISSCSVSTPIWSAFLLWKTDQKWYIQKRLPRRKMSLSTRMRYRRRRDIKNAKKLVYQTTAGYCSKTLRQLRYKGQSLEENFHKQRYCYSTPEQGKVKLTPSVANFFHLYILLQNIFFTSYIHHTKKHNVQTLNSIKFCKTGKIRALLLSWMKQLDF